MGNVIKIGDRTSTFKTLDRLLEGVDPQDVERVKNFVILEAQMLLGLTKTEAEEVDNYQPVVFNELWDVWQESNAGCYFCSDEVDPHDEAYGDTRKLCPMCVEKMTSFLKHCEKEMKGCSRL